jgi:cytochrome c oxidase subunit 2
VARSRLSAGPLLLRQTGLALLLLGVGFAASGCVGSHYQQFPQTTLEPTTEYGWKIQHLFEFILWPAAFVFIVVEGMLFYTIWRFRHRPGMPPPRQIHGNTTFEIAWTIAPAVILALIAVPTVQTIFAIASPEPGVQTMRVEVYGKQWWWEFRYPEQQIVTANELHIPVGTQIAFQINSSDVIHSFWFPRLGGKRDVVPNHENQMFLIAEQPDVYLGQCAEFCGTSHANMRMRAVAQTPADFEAWARNQQAPAAQPTDPLAQRGQEVFQRSACVGCHTVAGTNARAEVGPTLTHVGSRMTLAAGLIDNTPENMTRWIRNPQAVKPGAAMPAGLIPEEDLPAVVAYLESLK